MLFAGKQIGRYKILSALGTGGMGKVYLAEDTELERPIALKVLHSDFANDTERVRRFIQEAKAASALNHPNILTIYEIGSFDGTRFIASEYVGGKTLREKIKTDSFDLRETLDTALQVASALQAAHSAGIIHRDIKPENIMIRDDKLVKVLDFGIAKLTEKKNSLIAAEEATTIKGVTDPGVIIGTAAYMSPEQAEGKKIDARSDIFSFGILLYEMLCRRQPFTGNSLIQTLIAVLEKDPPSLSDFVKDCPIELEQYIYKALAKNRDERFQAIGDLIDKLQKLKRRLDFEDELKRGPSQNERTEIKTEILNVVTKVTASAAAANNLTGNSLPIVGRQTETKEICNLFRRVNVRLVTVTGIGGTGKTTLAKEVARKLLWEFTDGVFYVELAAVTDHELVVSPIAQSLGIKEAGSKPIFEILKDHLHAKKMLLVLDNFEQITEAAPIIGELLSASVNLKILVTSRVRLNLRFENEFILPPLEVPSDKRLTAIEMSEYPAVALFVERAKASRSSFELTEENAQTVAEICRKLDGLPLAIELAAARVKLLSTQGILNRLSNSLKLLTGVARALPARQQTMRGAIAWSYDLLESEEKKLLNRLAVFSGGFTLDGAEAVGNAKEDLSIDLLDAVASLVDKSLISQRDQSDGEPRFRMLEVVRELTLEKLSESGEGDEMKHLQAKFYADFSEVVEAELKTAKAAEGFDKLEQEHDNLRCALEWALENQPEIALRIVGAIFSFWVRRGYLSEGSKWIKQAIEKNGDDADLKLRANAYRGMGILSWMQGDLETAIPYYEESLRLSREMGDKQLISDTLSGLGSVNNLRGDLLSAQALLEESLSISREINHKSQISISLNNLGEIARQKENYEAALKYYKEAYTIAKQESFSLPLPTFTDNLAAISLLLGDYRSARNYALETLKYSEAVGDKLCIGGALDKFAVLAVEAGEMEKSARLFGAAQSIYEAADYQQQGVDQIFNEHYINKARSAIGEDTFGTAYKEGRAMQIEKAIALACGSTGNFGTIRPTNQWA